MSLSQTTGLTFGVGTGANDVSVAFYGTLGTRVNAALNGMTFKSTPGFTGTASILCRTHDFGNTGAGGALYGADKSINVAVQTVPAAPVAGNFQVAATEDIVKTVSGWNFTDANGDPAQSTLVTKLPVNGTLFRDANANNVIDAGEAIVVNTAITWADAVTAPKVKYLGNSNFNGSDSLSYVVRDTTGQQGATPATGSISVSAVNDAPVTTVPGAQTTSHGVPVIFNSTNGNTIVLSDVDAGTGQMRFRMDVTNGTVSLSQTTGLTFGVGTGANDVSVAFYGTLDAINAALTGLTFNPNPGFIGKASILFRPHDFGNTGAGGSYTARTRR